MEHRPDIEEPNQLAAADVLGQIRLNGQDGKFLHQETYQDIRQEIVQDQTTEDPNDILPRKQVGQQAPEGKTKENGAGEQVEDDNSDDELCSQAFAGASAPPEGLPLM